MSASNFLSKIRKGHRNLLQEATMVPLRRSAEFQRAINTEKFKARFEQVGDNVPLLMVSSKKKKESEDNALMLDETRFIKFNFNSAEA